MLREIKSLIRIKQFQAADIQKQIMKCAKDKITTKVKLMMSLSLTKHMTKKESSTGQTTKNKDKLPDLDREFINDNHIRKTFISKLTSKLNSTDFPMDLSPEDEIIRILKIHPSFRTGIQISKLAAELEKSKYFSDIKEKDK